MKKGQIQNWFRSKGAHLLKKPFAKSSLVETAGMMLDERQANAGADWLSLGHKWGSSGGLIIA